MTICIIRYTSVLFSITRLNRFVYTWHEIHTLRAGTCWVRHVRLRPLCLFFLIGIIEHYNIIVPLTCKRSDVVQMDVMRGKTVFLQLGARDRIRTKYLRLGFPETPRVRRNLSRLPLPGVPNISQRKYFILPTQVTKYLKYVKTVKVWVVNHAHLHMIKP